MAIPVCVQNAIDAAVAAAGGTGSGSIVTATTSNNVDGTAKLTITIDGTPTTFTACPTCSGGADGNDISTLVVGTPDAATGVVTVTHTAGGVATPFEIVPPCSFTAAGGQTATISGHFYDACATIALAADGDPETVAPAAGFPQWWRQGFTDGITGQGESWVVLNDTLGAPSWHQVG